MKLGCENRILTSSFVLMPCVSTQKGRSKIYSISVILGQGDDVVTTKWVGTEPFLLYRAQSLAHFTKPLFK